MSKIILPLTLIFAFSFMQKGFGTTHLSKSKHIVFLINDDDSLNYMAHETIPEFATLLQNQSSGKYRTTVILGKGENESYQFPNLERINDADLVVFFLRRVALPVKQINLIKNYINSGRPVLGIRTANHAFALLPNMTPARGHIVWDSFVADVLGCENRGYGAVEWGTNVSITKENASHPALLDIDKKWYSKGNVYKVAPLLDQDAEVLLTGEANEEVQPIAWTRKINGTLNKVFYTSLGHPEDFKERNFSLLLMNVINWLTKEP